MQRAAVWRVERCGIAVTFAVREYVLVFCRASEAGRGGSPRPAWSVMRPRYTLPPSASASRTTSRRQTAQLLVVPVCSTLALDTLAYESFLRSSGALDDALDVLGGIALADAAAVETARRRIHSLVMAAEVQHIVERLSA